MSRHIFLITLAVSLVLTGCTSTPAEKTGYVKNPLNLTHQVYAKLKKVNDKYRFTQFSSLPLSGGAWVQLSDMTPIWNTQKEDCLTGIVEFTNEALTCKTSNDELFRYKGTDFTLRKTTGYIIGSLLSLGIWATMPPGAVEFDEDDYLDALEEAKAALNRSLESEGTSYTSILMEVDKSMKTFETSYQRTSNAYTYKIDKKIIFNDKSGLFDINSININDLASLKKNTLKNIHDGPVILSNHFGASYTEALAQRNSDFMEELKQSTTNVNVHCYNNRLTNINYEIQCPATVSTAAKKVDIGLTINSLKFKKILPRKIIEKDDNIEVVLRDGIFNFTNKSSSYIEVNSVSFYYNGKIASLYNMSKELPPASEQNLTYLNRFPLEKNALDFLNVTKKMALKKNLNFGIAIKYRILDTNKEITLYQNNKYSLLELI